MNLLSLRLCVHDSNISYFDGSEIHYIKTERLKNIKHHALDNLWEWKKIIYDLWNLKENDLDDISIIFDPWRYGLEFNKNNFFPIKDCKILNATQVNHHYAHALSNDLYFGDFKNHVVIDGFGDWSDAASIISNHKLIDVINKDIHGSIGLEYSMVGSNIFGLKAHPNDFAGKVMCLQAYGRFDPILYKEFKNLTIKNINVLCNFSNYIKYKGSEKLAELTRLDWWNTIHKKLGEIILDYILNFFKKDDYISYSGGVCHNIIWNTFLKNNLPNINISAHCDDEGLSLGGLKFLLNKNKISNFKLNYFQSDEAPNTRIEEERLQKIARLLSEGKIIALYDGHGEVGPRALGHRSLLISPFIKNAKDKINKIKKRESFRPFGGVVLNEDRNKYSDLSWENSQMLYNSKIFNVKELEHADSTCRIQTVKNGNLYKILKYFKELTGESILLNTSLNISGYPIISNLQNLKKFKEQNKEVITFYGNQEI